MNTSAPLLAYNNDSTLKEQMLAEMRWHQSMDMLFKGLYDNHEDGVHFRGCFVGCAINSINRIKGTKLVKSDHSQWEAIGLPAWFALLCDRIFENLQHKESQQFPIELLDAIKPGVAVEPLWRQFNLAVVQKAQQDLMKQPYPACSNILAEAVTLAQQTGTKNAPSSEKWQELYVAAQYLYDSQQNVAETALVCRSTKFLIDVLRSVFTGGLGPYAEKHLCAEVLPAVCQLYICTSPAHVDYTTKLEAFYRRCKLILIDLLSKLAPTNSPELS